MHKYFGRVPAYVYLKSDGPYPKIAPGHKIYTREQVEGFWHGQKVFNEDGIAQETCRDFSHLGSGLSSMAHMAETARIQGWDLFKYTDVGNRLKCALEFHTKYQMQPHNRPDWLCNGSLTANLGPGMYFFSFSFFASSSLSFLRPPSPSLSYPPFVLPFSFFFSFPPPLHPLKQKNPVTLCPSTNFIFSFSLAVTEVAYNALSVRMGEFMPQTKVFTKDQRPAYTNWLDTGFETLSHALDMIELRKSGKRN